MTADTPQLDALKAYLLLLKNNGSKRAIISQSEHLSRQLLSKLTGQPVNQATYRLAVNALLDSLPDNYRNNALSVAREFYPFLISDLKSVATLMSSGNYRGAPESSGFKLDKNIRTIDELINIANSTTLTHREFALHTQYLTCLTALGAAENIINTRGKISKTLLYLSRELSINGDNYRAILDQVSPLFSKEETRGYFFGVAREFYYFLAEDPNALEMVKIKG